MCGMTRRIILLAGCLLAGFSVRAQLQERNIVIDSVRVTARRVLKDIGTQKSALDTVALRESVTNSLAEVLSQNSPVFIKSYGRATLATASVRGTAPSHTQVTWNGMKLNSPMLGMVDFSMIPSYFIDDANLYYGASSVNVAGGGLGGAVALGTRAADAEGFALRYVQGVSSYTTFDEFLRLSYGKGRWRAATRAYYASSKNDFHYTNYRKKVFDTNQQGNIVGYSYPRERNRNGSFNDLHLLQEFYLNSASGNRWNLAAWYIASRRGVPMLNVDYRDESESRNRQRENTLRVAGGWERSISRLKLAVRAGYSYTDLVYTYAGDAGNGTLTEMIRSESRAHTAFARAEAEYYFTDRLLLMANLSADQSVVSSIDRAAGHTTGDYDKARVEYSGFLSVKYRPAERLGLALSLREERYGYDWTPLVPAAFADYLLSRRGRVVVKASVSRNFRYPTLNDLYFEPGGNDTLRPERGLVCDFGTEFALGGEHRRWSLRGEVSAYDSRISDWIVWLPTFKGFWSPVNVRKVHSYGAEFKGEFSLRVGRDWRLSLRGNYAITHSVNRGDPVNWADEAIGKQLVYIPVYSAACTGRLDWRRWSLVYKWNYYSRRYTTSSNETATRFDVLGAYYMNDVSLERRFAVRWADLSLKFSVNNLFDEEYESVLSRPMAGRNFGFFLEIAPHRK